MTICTYMYTYIYMYVPGTNRPSWYHHYQRPLVPGTSTCSTALANKLWSTWRRGRGYMNSRPLGRWKPIIFCCCCCLKRAGPRSVVPLGNSIPTKKRDHRQTQLQQLEAHGTHPTTTQGTSSFNKSKTDSPSHKKPCLFVPHRGKEVKDKPWTGGSDSLATVVIAHSPAPSKGAKKEDRLRPYPTGLGRGSTISIQRSDW